MKSDPYTDPVTLIEEIAVMSREATGTIFGREPALLLSLLQAGIVLALTFGLRLTVEQVGAILAFSAVLLGVITRSVVTPSGQPRLETGTVVTVTEDNQPTYRQVV